MGERDPGERRNEVPVVVGEPEELLNLLEVPRRRPVKNGRNLAGVHLNCLGPKDVAEELDALPAKLALRRLGVQLVVMRRRKTCRTSASGRVNEEVVEVYDDGPVEHVAERVIDVALDEGRRIAKPERHDAPLRVPEARTERRLPLVALADAHLVVRVAEVDLGERARSLHAVEQLLGQRQRGAVAGYDLVEPAVVGAQPARAVLLRD
jgi:hypothetical protein